MNRIEAMTEYSRAQKLGVREYREAIVAGRYPYLPVLDDILENASVETQLPIGVVEIPLDQVVGTKTAGRTAAFASNFMPLLESDTEFASKWLSLCQAHVEEGIRDPIRCYEYLGRFYVQEGNKRVSVLKYFGADSIAANVIRVVPQYADRPQVRVYYEFMEFYAASGVYYLQLTMPSCRPPSAKSPGKSGRMTTAPTCARCTTGSGKPTRPAAAAGCGCRPATCWG